MTSFSRFDLIEQHPSLFLRETSISAPKALALPYFIDEHDDLGSAFDFLNPCPYLTPFEVFDTVTDLIQIEKPPSFSSYRRVERRVSGLGNELCLRSLSDRVAALELSFDRLAGARTGGGDRKYTWTAEIDDPEKDGFDRKYKWSAEIKGGKSQKKKVTKEEEHGGEVKNYKWTAEVKGKGKKSPIVRTYTFKASTGGAGECSESEKKDKREKEKKGKKIENGTRMIVIEEPEDHGAVVLRQAFAKRAGADAKRKGKKKELSPQDAALAIQVTFRAYLIRRSQVLRALRELAVAKTKLKELRVFFNNFSYRSRISRDAEERQRFSEKIIVLLLTVDAIEGADMMVRPAKRSMVDELEAMLEVVDPQLPGKSLSFKRRTFDMPDGAIQREIAAGVAKVVEIIDQQENGVNTFEACL